MPANVKYKPASEVSQILNIFTGIDGQGCYVAGYENYQADTEECQVAIDNGKLGKTGHYKVYNTAPFITYNTYHDKKYYLKDDSKAHYRKEKVANCKLSELEIDRQEK